MKALEIRSKTGKTIRFEAEYICRMSDKIVDADGDRILVGNEPTTVGSMLTVYVDGEKVDSCWNPNFWGLIDLSDRPGVRKIWGLKIAFTDPAQASEYERWIASVKEDGTGEDVKAAEAAQKAADTAEEIAYLENVINKAETQTDIPSEAEKQARLAAYNRINNEGGEGYLPWIVSREQYDASLERLAEIKHS